MQTGCLHAVGSSMYVFFGFLRAGEVVVPSASDYDPALHLSHGDVRAENTTTPQYLEIQIKASKTDPFWRGVSIYLGRGSCDLCPVAAVLNYMVQRGSAPGPFFCFVNGNYLTRERFVTAIRTALAAAGINPSHYVGISFWIGAATSETTRRLGLPHTNIGPVRELCIYSVHMNPEGDPLRRISTAG